MEPVLSRRIALALESPVFTDTRFLRDLFVEGLEGVETYRHLTDQQKRILKAAEQELHLVGLQERLEEILAL